MKEIETGCGGIVRLEHGDKVMFKIFEDGGWIEGVFVVGVGGRNRGGRPFVLTNNSGAEGNRYTDEQGRHRYHDGVFYGYSWELSLSLDCYDIIKIGTTKHDISSYNKLLHKFV
jgi:hypothetical protein